MPILTRPAFAKGSANEITLNKADLALEVSDLYFGDPANWKQVVLFYETNKGKQRKALIYDASQANPAANFDISERARDLWNVKKVAIYDFDGGSLTINRGDLTVAEFDILFPFFVRDFVANGAFDANLGEYGFGAESFTQDGLAIGVGGGFGTAAASMNSSAPVQPAVYLTRTYIAAHSGGFELNHYGSNPQDARGESFSALEISNAVGGSYLERKIVVYSAFDEAGLYNNNNLGSITVSKMEFFETDEAVPVIANPPTSITVLQNPDKSVNISWVASDYTLTPVTYAIRARVNGGPYFDIDTNINGTTYHDTTVYTTGDIVDYLVITVTEPIDGWLGQKSGIGMFITIV